MIKVLISTEAIEKKCDPICTQNHESNYRYSPSGLCMCNPFEITMFSAKIVENRDDVGSALSYLCALRRLERVSESS